MEANEPLETAAARELEEETGVKPQDVLLTQAGPRRGGARGGLQLAAGKEGWACHAVRGHPSARPACCSTSNPGIQPTPLFPLLSRLLPPPFPDRWVRLATLGATPAAGASALPLQRWCRRPSWACRQQMMHRCSGMVQGGGTGYSLLHYRTICTIAELLFPLQSATTEPHQSTAASLVFNSLPSRPPHPHRPRRTLTHPQAAQWYPLDQLPRLAFDHKLIVRTAFRHLAAQGTVQQQRPTLVEQLEQAADRLEGPWQQQ